MKYYAHYGFNEFFIALGYKGEVIKRYFRDYHDLSNSMTINMTRGSIQLHNKQSEDWIIHLMDTGLNTMTGGRIKHLEPWLNKETFMVTYGDGVCNVNLHDLLAFHKACGRIATVTAVRPPARFGGLVFEGDLVSKFTEKPQIGEGWINGGFLVLEPAIFNYLEKESDSLEVDALEQLAEERQLVAFRHPHFWQCMDTLRDKRLLEGLWQQEKAPWKVWN
jgi:glucose-1-phosphate cytidylyltransferase